MRGSHQDLPVALEVPEGTLWQADWGDHVVEFGRFTGELDPAPVFRGLPDDRCQAPHWGYVMKGQLRFRFGDREEVYRAGDAYYAPPGHTPFFEPGVEYVEFSPAGPLAETMKVVEQNMASGVEAQAER
jgi:hypothetical protein